MPSKDKDLSSSPLIQDEHKNEDKEKLIKAQEEIIALQSLLLAANQREMAASKVLREDVKPVHTIEQDSHQKKTKASNDTIANAMVQQQTRVPKNMNTSEDRTNFLVAIFHMEQTLASMGFDNGKDQATFKYWLSFLSLNTPMVTTRLMDTQVQAMEYDDTLKTIIRALFGTEMQQEITSTLHKFEQYYSVFYTLFLNS